MSEHYTKTKFTNYTNTKQQQKTITDGYCSSKYRNKTITTKSKNQLKTRDTTTTKYRKHNYNKYNNKIENELDDIIEHNEILIENNKRELISINEFISNKLDNLQDKDTEEWVVC